MNFHPPAVRTILDEVDYGSDATDKLRSARNCEHTCVKNSEEDWFASVAVDMDCRLQADV